MKCPKCGYVSHDYLSACRKCRIDLLGFKAQMQLHAVQAGNIDLRRVLGGMQPSPMASGDFDMGEGLFGSPMLVEAQAEDGFDINLDDDFSFTPSGMSLESLDGFDVSNPEAMSAEQRRSADTGRPKIEAPETGYATVMMDISSLHDEAPPLAPTGDTVDTVKADLNSAELGSSAGQPSDLDLTPMEPERTTREPQLPNEALSADTALLFSPSLPASFATEGDGTDDLNHESGELILPSFDADVLDVEATDAGTSSSGSALDAREASFTMPELSDPDAHEELVDLFTEEISFAIDPLAAPEPPPMEFPSLQTSLQPAPEPKAAALIDEASIPEAIQSATEDNATRSPDTGGIAAALKPGNPGSPRPDDNVVTATPQETTLADEQPPPLRVEPAAEPNATASPKTRNTTMELDISDVQLPETWGEVPVFPDLPEQTDALLDPFPDEVTIVDAPSPFLPSKHVPADGSITLPEAARTEADEIDDELDMELLFPDEQPPQKHD